MRPFPSAVAALLLPCGALSAGFTAHNVIARRATHFERFSTPETFAAFNGLSASRIDALQGGSPFPDYLYTCGDSHDAGEYAHWEPFHMNAASYIRSTYPNWASESRDGAGAGLVAFMNGAISHYIADLNWHGMCNDCEGRGLIKVGGYADYTCTGDLCSSSHTATDTGGEFVAADQLDLSWYPDRKWYVPAQDLENIFKLSNETCAEVSPTWSTCPTTSKKFINECSVIFYAGSFSIAKFGNILYPILSSRLGEFLSGPDGLINHEVGGVDDSAAWTAFMQDRFASWVVDGPPLPHAAQPDELQALFRARGEDPPFEAKRNWMQALRKVLNNRPGHPFKLTQAEDGSGGSFVGFEATEGGLKEHAALFYEMAEAIVDDFIMQVGGEGQASWFSLEEAAEIKRRLIEEVDRFTGKADRKLVGAEAKLDLFGPKAEPLVSGLGPHLHFGYAQSVADADADGCLDVLVGSPTSSTPAHPQTGAASLHLCPQSAADSHKSVPLLPRIATAGDASAGVPPQYERFGATVALADVDGDGQVDAVVCAPSWGAEGDLDDVAGNYTGRCDFYQGPLATSVGADGVAPTASIFGDRKWGVFGKKVLVKDVNADGVPDVIVSAPQAGGFENAPYGTYSNQGAVYVFSGDAVFKPRGADGSDMKKASAEATHVLYGVDERQHFGEHIDVLNGQLLVGAPYFHGAGGVGAVGRISSFDLRGDAVAKEQRDPLWTLTGCKHSQRIGRSFAAKSDGGMLAVSEIGFNHTISFNLLNQEINELRSGKVHIVQASQLVAGDYTMCPSTTGFFEAAVTASIEPHDASKLPKFFPEARFGSAMLWSADGSRLFVGAPGADANAGAVFKYDVSGKELTAYYNDQKDGKKEYGRFGSTLSQWGNDALLVGAPMAGKEGLAAPDYEEFGELLVLNVKKGFIFGGPEGVMAA